MFKILSVFLFIITATDSFSFEKVIYGRDGRVEIYSAQEKWQKKSKSTAALISLDQLVYNESTTKYHISLVGETTMGDKLSLCSEVNFREQINISTCSGFLVKDDVLLTAGHCATGEMEDICSSGKYAWVFDYEAKKYENSKDIEFDRDDVVLCKSVLTATMNRTVDFAAIKLDRKLSRSPLEFNRSNKIGDDDELVVIGTPWGLPTKVTLGGRVLKNNEKYFFTAALDTFQGNSGSAVFNKRTGLVEGILVRGMTDAVKDEDNYCRRVNKCDEQGENCLYADGFQVGEEVMRMPFIYKKIKSTL